MQLSTTDKRRLFNEGTTMKLLSSFVPVVTLAFGVSVHAQETEESGDFLVKTYDRTQALPNGLSFLTLFFTLSNQMENGEGDIAIEWTASNLDISVEEASNLLPKLIVIYEQGLREAELAESSYACSATGEPADDLRVAADAKNIIYDEYYDRAKNSIADADTAQRFAQWVSDTKSNITSYTSDYRKMEGSGDVDLKELLTQKCGN